MVAKRNDRSYTTRKNTTAKPAAVKSGIGQEDNRKRASPTRRGGLHSDTKDRSDRNDRSRRGLKSQYIRKSRAKRCIEWDEYAQRSNSLCAERLPRVARRFPGLTPHQLRVATLVMDLLPSQEIAGILGISEHAVDKVRSRIRALLKMKAGTRLAGYLLTKAA
jgi:DNA-binding CsgD family transcriptional regulator